MSTDKPQPVGQKSINGVPDWIKALFSNSPALLIVVMLFLWIDGRIRSPDEKKQYLLPIEMRLREVDKDITHM